MDRKSNNENCYSNSEKVIKPINELKPISESNNDYSDNIYSNRLRSVVNKINAKIKEIIKHNPSP